MNKIKEILENILVENGDHADKEDLEECELCMSLVEEAETKIEKHIEKVKEYTKDVMEINLKEKDEKIKEVMTDYGELQQEKDEKMQKLQDRVKGYKKYSKLKAENKNLRKMLDENDNADNYKINRLRKENKILGEKNRELKVKNKESQDRVKELKDLLNSCKDDVVGWYKKYSKLEAENKALKERADKALVMIKQKRKYVEHEFINHRTGSKTVSQEKFMDILDKISEYIREEG